MLPLARTRPCPRLAVSLRPLRPMALLLPLLLAGPALAAPPPLQVTTLTEVLDGAVGGVAVDRVGFVYVADFGNRVWRVTPSGEVEVFADGLYGASGNAIDGEGYLWQSSFFGDYLVRIARDGTVERVAGGLEGPVGVSVDGDGRAVVCNCRGNNLVTVDAGGEVEKLAEGDLFNCPNGITRDPDGNLYVANFSDTRVIKVTPEGEASLLATTPGGGNGHIVLADGALFVTGFRSNLLFRVALDGSEVEVVAGTGAFESADGTGSEASFSSPNGIAYDSTRDVLYVNDFLVPFSQRTREPPKSVLRRIAFPSLTQVLTAALEDGTEALDAAYHRYKASRPGRFTELELNAFGYQLLQGGQTADAIHVFRLNTGSYPASGNTWDSLGEAYKTAGETDDAIAAYRKALELSPGNANAVKMLRELGAEPD